VLLEDAPRLEHQVDPHAVGDQADGEVQQARLGDQPGVALADDEPGVLEEALRARWRVDEQLGELLTVDVARCIAVPRAPERLVEAEPVGDAGGRVPLLQEGPDRRQLEAAVVQLADEAEALRVLGAVARQPRVLRVLRGRLQQLLRLVEADRPRRHAGPLGQLLE
jgi:hypothetical protein